jgi:hypothetical protein
MALVHRVGWDARFFDRSPWFWPLRPAAEAFCAYEDWPRFDDLNALYARATQGQALPQLRFRPNVRKQDKRAAGRVVLSALYDARITLSHEVPTRERDWHDLFNALCFSTFAHSKLALHARQFRALRERVPEQAARLPPARTPEQDALTLFDEGGVVVAVEPTLALQLAVASPEQRAAACSELIAEHKARVVPFGHALFEHLVEGLRCPGGCTQVVAVGDALAQSTDFLPALDRALAAVIADRARFTSPRQCSQIRLETLQLWA